MKLPSFCFWSSIWLFCLWGSTQGYGKEVVLLPSSSDILLDSTTIRTATTPTWLQNNKSVQKRIWFEIQITSTTDEPFLLEGLSPLVAHMQVWIVRQNEAISHQEAGRAVAFRQRYLAHKNFTFPLPREKGAYSIWIALDNPQEGDIAFKIRSFRFFSEYAFSEYFFLGLYYGLLLIAGIYNMFLYLKSRIRLHFYYALYVGGCILLSFREDGLGFQFFWPQFPAWNELLVFHLARPVFLLSFLVYSIAFLGLRKQKKILYLLYSLAFTYFFLELTFFILPRFQVKLDWLIAAISILVYLSAVRKCRTDLYSRYFVAGFSIVIAGLLINLLRFFSLLPSNVFTVYSFNYGIFFEVVIFSIALAERVKGIQQERNEALSKWVAQLNENDTLQKQLIHELEEKRLLQDKVNRELELKVQERTVELKTANEQLKSYAHKVDQLNSALDLHNYSLKKEVKQATLSHINDEVVDFAKFQEIFPSEHLCLKTIEQMKWPKGFVCRKCGNTQGSPSKVWYRQKCTRCGSIESVTAHTLFHNVRIPLQKAFYITYLSFSQSDSTLEKLSEDLDLRKATVWLLRKKVQERVKTKKYQKEETWQGLVLDK